MILSTASIMLSPKFKGPEFPVSGAKFAPEKLIHCKRHNLQSPP